jgi:small GTP-binding protein
MKMPQSLLAGATVCLVTLACTQAFVTKSPGSSFGSVQQKTEQFWHTTKLSVLSQSVEEDEDLDDFQMFEDDRMYDDEEEGELSTSTVDQKPIRRFKRPKKIPLIAIIGRPNVGKSALVNRIAGTQSGGAIVADVSGITRDRTYRNAEFLGEQFQIVDTGGLVFDDDERTLFAKEIREQAMIAIAESAGVIFVVDGQVGMTSMDLQLAEFLRKKVTKDIPVLVAVNKCESEKTGGLSAAEFWNLGLGEPFAVSALHGVGTAEMMESMFTGIAEKGSAIQGFGTKVLALQVAKGQLKSQVPLVGEDEADVFLRQFGLEPDKGKVIQRYEEALAAFDEDDVMEEINVAIVGRPNVGKRFPQYWYCKTTVCCSSSILQCSNTVSDYVRSSFAYFREELSLEHFVWVYEGNCQ